MGSEFLFTVDLDGLLAIRKSTILAFFPVTEPGETNEKIRTRILCGGQLIFHSIQRMETIAEKLDEQPPYTKDKQ